MEFCRLRFAARVDAADCFPHAAMWGIACFIQKRPQKFSSYGRALQRQKRLKIDRIKRSRPTADPSRDQFYGGWGKCTTYASNKK
jgi:hypothetical protein